MLLPRRSNNNSWTCPGAVCYWNVDVRPHLVLHNAVSADSRLLPYDMVDMAVYYGLVADFQEQATLAGSETLLVAGTFETIPEDAADSVVPPAQTGDTRPLLIVPDSRGRIRTWCWLLSQPYWRAGVALCSDATPADHLVYLDRFGVDRVVTGSDKVDLGAALEILCDRHGVERIRADSGGTLNGVLLRLGLVSEISLLVAPVLMGNGVSRPFYLVPDACPAQLTHLTLMSQQRLFGDYLWLRYEVSP